IHMYRLGISSLRSPRSNWTIIFSFQFSCTKGSTEDQCHRRRLRYRVMRKALITPAAKVAIIKPTTSRFSIFRISCHNFRSTPAATLPLVTGSIDPVLEYMQPLILTQRACALEVDHPIHRSAWNKNSRKFKVASYSSKRFQPLDNRRWCSPPAPNRGDLVAVVAPFCIKALRLVTMELPEKFSPIGVGTN